MRDTDSRKSIGLKAVLVTLVMAAISFPLTFLIWPPLVPASAPPTAQALGYALLLAECLALGGGIAFLSFGYPAVKQLPVTPGLAFASYLGIGFYLVNWWPHDHLHALALPLSFTKFIWASIAIEYVFHAGMMVFGAVLALFFAKVVLARSASGRGREAAGTTVRDPANPKEVMLR